MNSYEIIMPYGLVFTLPYNFNIFKLKKLFNLF